MQKWIVTRYKRGAGVFITINETDGTGRRGENMTRYRAAFVDLDGAPLPTSWPLEPSFVIESSAGKYHCYWLLQERHRFDRLARCPSAACCLLQGRQSNG